MKTSHESNSSGKATAEALHMLEAGIRNLFDSENYKKYLRMLSRLPNYSSNNCILLMCQMPYVSMVCGYKAWITNFNRFVRKGEKSLKIIAPMFFEKQKDDGTTETVTRYRVAHVFDVSQTDSIDGTEMPEFCHKLSADVDGYDRVLDALISISSVPVAFEVFPGSANGYYSQTENRIVVKSGLSQAQTLKTLIHEEIHSIIHTPDGERKDDTRNMKETAAESAAYVVMNWLGIPSDDYSFAYVAGYNSDESLPEFKACLDIVQKTASSIIQKLEQKGVQTCMTVSVKP